MFFMSMNPEKIATKIAAKLGKELKLPAPPFEIVMEGQAKEGAVATAMGRLSRTYLGGDAKPMLTVEMKPQGAARPFEFMAHVVQTTGPVLGTLTYSTRLAKPIAGAATLEDAKTFSKSKFVGDSSVVAKLNANSALIKKINKFERDKYVVGGRDLTAPRSMKIEPDGTGAVLIATTLPRSRWFGPSMMDVKAFLEIAAEIEASM